MMREESAIDTVTFAKALADETRQKIMALCCCQLLSVGDIVASLDVAQPTVSHHLKILKNAGLVRSERQGKQVFYTLNQARLAQGCCQVAEEFAPDENIRLVVDRPV
ncbi:MAG: metalloregulator ArsR/SmtB family transcription factor [Anaerolineae bacterium]|nr:metalloregulator ArsR/SmtB family transcription factor [Anaerolineae bacterium]